MNTFINNNNKKKVVFIMGATGTGKSRLSVDLATQFRGEIINSDKMQVFKGLEIVTKKITHAEKQGVRNYLLGEIEPDSNFTAENFCLNSIVYLEFSLKTQCVPIIVGGLNSYIEKLLEDPVVMTHLIILTKMNTFINKKKKKKVVFIMGATGTGKSRLSVDLATNFRVEIINTDKMQVFKIVEIVTNKITHAEKQGVRHYFLEQSVLNRRDDMRVYEMVNAAKMNTFNNNNNKFNKKKVVFILGARGTGKSRHSVDLATHFRGEIINSDKMQVYKGLEIVTNKMTHAEKQGVRQYLLGLVDEVRQIFIPDAYYTKRIRQSIGVPEMAKYLREEKNIDGYDESKKMILQASISNIKRNTRIFICNQLEKI
uniref:Isopentenyltransferase n=1 Tax=Solanum tuberosum TaxID=4113 RepID=M1DKI2_SOLTU